MTRELKGIFLKMPVSVKKNHPYGYATAGRTSKYDFVSVNINIIGLGLTSPANGVNMIQKGGSITITAFPADKYTFVKWLEYPEITEPTITLENIEDDVVVTAYFTRLYKFNHQIIGNGSVEFSPNISNNDEVSNKTFITAEATADYGYEFDRYSFDRTKDDYNVKTGFMLNNDLFLFTRFRKKVYTIENYAIGNGNIIITDHNDGKYNHGDLITFNAVPDDGWYFHGWKFDFRNVSESLIEDHVLESNLKVVPIFREL